MKPVIVSEMPLSQQAALLTALTPKLTKYVPHAPTPKQSAFLLLDCLEAFYGGAAGGGKSDALLMAALQYMDVPGYNAILFRKTYSDLALPEALMDRAHEWLAPFRNAKQVRWREKDKVYMFPTGPGLPPATLTFGYMEHENDKYRYQGSAYQFVGFDEVTQILESCYLYMFSRLRRLVGKPVPLRVRSASNPGGEGHMWVQKRFLEDGPAAGRIFIPATLDDNPFLDRESYVRSLQELDPVTRAQLLEGNWTIRHGGRMFKRQWFHIVDIVPAYMKLVRYWDMASTEPTKKNPNPDWTVGVLIGEARGYYYILDVRRFRARPSDVEALIHQTAKIDGKHVNIWLEQEPGASGQQIIDHYIRNVLKGYAVRGNKTTGSKISRANPASAAAEQGRVSVLRAPWNNKFFDELELFPDGEKDDQVDGFSGAFEKVGTAYDVSAMPAGIGDKESYWRG
jgi:predicted phage terminase large subunit-like protein